jgi:hypothetical protein
MAADAVARARVGISGDVSRREDPRFARLEVLVDENAPFHGESGVGGKSVVRAYADPGNDDVRANVLAIVQRHGSSIDPACRAPEVKGHLVRFVQFTNEVAELWTHDPLQRAVLRRDDVHLQATHAKRGRDLEANEAGAEDYRGMRSRCGGDDCAAVSEGAQVVDAARVGQRDRQMHRVRASRKEQRSELVRGTVVEHDALAGRVEGRHRPA